VIYLKRGVSFLAGGLFDKIANLLGYTDQDDELEGFEDEYEGGSKGRKRAPVLSLHTSPEVKIVVMTPEGFDEAEKIANHLKNRKPVIVNFIKITKEVAQRILDFLGGTVFALNGSMQRVSKDAFLFVPSNMTVYSELSGISQEPYITELDREGANEF
jgi:cell division inhibitor SepF